MLITSSKNITLLLFACLSATFLAVVIDGFVDFKDSSEYIVAANNLQNYSVLYAGDLNHSLDFRLFSKRPVAYPFFLSINNLLWLAYLAQFGLVLLNFFIGLNLIPDKYRGKKVLVLYCLAFLAFILPTLHAGFVMADLMLCSLIGVLAYYLLQINNNLNPFLIGLVFVLGLLTKPVLLPAIPFLFLLILIRADLNYSLKSMVLPMLILVGVFLRNHQTTGVAEFSSISWINLVNYNAKLVVANKYGLDSAELLVESLNPIIPETKKEYVAYRKVANSQATEAILSNLPSYIKVHFIGTIKMLIDPGRFEIFRTLKIPEGVSLTENLFSGNYTVIRSVLSQHKSATTIYLILLLVNLLRLVGLAGLVFVTEGKKWLIPLGLIVAYFIAITGPIGAGRFLIPASTLLTVFSAVGWGLVLDFFQKRSKS